VLRTARYRTEQYILHAPALLFLFSDGAYEVSRPDGTMLEYAHFQEVLTRATRDSASGLGEVLRFAREVRGDEVLEDDFSIVRMMI
jgi:serine phosphatase RsbU (regulator of sigma subunit)